jgi:hypothetical protein
MTLRSAAEDRKYVITIRTIAIGIFLFAAGEVGYALTIGSSFLVKDGMDWIYDVLLYGMAAIIFGQGARAERVAALLGAAIMFVSIGETDTTWSRRSSRHATSSRCSSASPL